MMKKSTQEETKLHNSRLVLSTIYQQGEISRVDVARQTGLTRTTVSEVVGKFIQEGLVVETGVSPSRGGKPAILLRLDDDARHLVGIDLAEQRLPRGGGQPAREDRAAHQPAHPGTGWRGGAGAWSSP